MGGPKEGRVTTGMGRAGRIREEKGSKGSVLDKKERVSLDFAIKESI